MLKSRSHVTPSASHATIHFGAFLKIVRNRQGIRQSHVLAHLPGWTQANYSRIETGEVAPAFDQLATIYVALHQAGVTLTPQDRQEFLTLARTRIEAKKTYKEQKTDREWDELRLELSRTEHKSSTHEKTSARQGHSASRPRLLETRHLVGREDWVASVIASLQERLPKKLIVLQGPVGIGKSSELHRLAQFMLSAEPLRVQIVLCELPAFEREIGPESALDLFLGTLFAEMGLA